MIGAMDFGRFHGDHGRSDSKLADRYATAKMACITTSAVEHTTSGGARQTVTIPAKFAGIIIGKAGKSVKDIQTKTGCKILVVNHQSGGQDCSVIIKGDINAVPRAEGMIRGKVAKAFRQEYLFPPPKPSRLPQRHTPSLIHLALKTAAVQWHLFDKEDVPNLAGIPLHLRRNLAEYLSRYGPSIDVTSRAPLWSGSETTPPSSPRFSQAALKAKIASAKLPGFVMPRHDSPDPDASGEAYVDEHGSDEDMVEY